MTPTTRPVWSFAFNPPPSAASGCLTSGPGSARIKSGGCWQSPDKFKAIRLLGRQPIAAADVADVATIFQAAFVLDDRREHAFAELRSELFDDEMIAYKDRLTGRRLESFGKDETRARQALLEIVDRATEVINARLDLHRQRADLDAALAADRVSFDDSPEGDRLRRYELSANRVMLRNLDEFFKVRRETEDSEPAAEAERGTVNAEQGAVAKPAPGRDPATFTDAEWARSTPARPTRSSMVCLTTTNRPNTRKQPVRTNRPKATTLPIATTRPIATIRSTTS